MCGNEKMIDVLDLGVHSLTSVFPLVDEPSPIAAPQVLAKCDDSGPDSTACGLVQMRHAVSASELYTDNYGYRSGLNATMTDHLAGIAGYIEALVDIRPGDVVLDIGANDATLLSKYVAIGAVKIAIDPSGTQFLQHYPPDVKLVPEFFDRGAFERAAGCDARAKVVTTVSMFYDLPDPQQFADDVAAVMADDGVWLMEQSYLPAMVERLSFDTVCHEHLEYYALKQIEFIAGRAGLRAVGVSFNDCNGGSFRVTLAKAGCDAYPVDEGALSEARAREAAGRWNTREPYDRFAVDVDVQRRALMQFLRRQKLCGKTIAIYGASTKGNTLLQHYRIGRDLVACAAERNPRKFGRKTPGSEIPILPEDQVRAMAPDYMLVLPWHFRDEFVARESAYLAGGGALVFPLPRLDIVFGDGRRSALVTGASGQVGAYLTRQLADEGMRVFALSRKPADDPIGRAIGIPCDATDLPLLDAFVRACRPDEIYNLAAVTDSEESLEAPVKAHTLNATVVVQLLESAKRVGEGRGGDRVRLMQAGSVEVFRGHPGPATADEGSLELLRPRTPYAVAKLAAFWAVRNARELDCAHAVTCILSNVESRLRRPAFVTRKIADYFRAGDYYSPLRLGNAGAACDWIHAEDAAGAMRAALRADAPSDYVVCSGSVSTVAEFAAEAALQALGSPARWNDDLTRLVTSDGATVLVEAGSPEHARRFERGAQEARNPKTRVAFDNAKMMSIFSPTRSSLQAIVADMLN